MSILLLILCFVPIYRTPSASLRFRFVSRANSLADIAGYARGKRNPLIDLLPFPTCKRYITSTKERNNLDSLYLLSLELRGTRIYHTSCEKRVCEQRYARTWRLEGRSLNFFILLTLLLVLRVRLLINELAKCARFTVVRSFKKSLRVTYDLSLICFWII